MMNISQKNLIDLTDRKVAVIGGARSGLAAALLLTEVGASPFVSEASNNIDKLFLGWGTSGLLSSVKNFSPDAFS